MNMTSDLYSVPSDRGCYRQEKQLRIDVPGGCWLCIVLYTLTVVHADIGLDWIC